jgi:hypothetical protein
VTDDHADDDTGRVTAPMQAYSIREVALGLLVLLVGGGLAYAVPASLVV